MPGRETIIGMLRWLGVLPAALLGAIAGSLLARLVTWLVLLGGSISADDPSWLKGLLSLVNHVPAGAAFAALGTLVAPRWKVIAAMVLALVWLLLSLWVHVLSQQHVGATNFAHLAMEALGAVLGGAAASLVVRSVPK